METYQHSVTLDVEKCKGCTHCLKHCPTEAIRIRDGHAVINSARCIDCGQCIRVCPYKAKKANFDTFDSITEPFKIALPAPSLFGQFENLDDVDYVLQGLVDLGFDQVFEVAQAAEIVSEYTRRYMADPALQKPVISSACPVVVRLISLRYPYLCDHVMPLLPPMEIAAAMAREKAHRDHPALKDEDIAVVFISPCPAKASYVKNGFLGRKSGVDYVLSMSEMYFKLLGVMKRGKVPRVSTSTGMIGLSWASTSGESRALMNDRYLASDGIENVISVMDKIEDGEFPLLDFVELNACTGGCVGGVAAVENPFIARVRLQTLRRYMPVSLNRLPKRAEGEEAVPERMLFPKDLYYAPVQQLSPDRLQAMRMMQQIEDLREKLPTMDCGSCGAPTCRAFAEDVVKGECCEEDCFLQAKKRLKELLAERGESEEKPSAEEEK